MNLTASLSLLSLLFLKTCTAAGNPTWDTLRQHVRSRPDISRQLKPTPYHYGRSMLDYGGNHPFERQRRLPDDPESIDYDGATDFETLRIRFVTEPLESRFGESSDLDAQVNTIITKVLPAVGNTWMSALGVVPVQGNIPIEERVCFGLFQDSLPTSILDNGVENADLVVIVSGADSAQCGKTTLAYATSCVLDQFDRPIVGYINFCLGNMGDRRLQDEELYDFSQVDSSNLIFESEMDRNGDITSDEAIAQSAVIATHEVGHVLGVDNDMYIFFRDPTTGEPLVPRPIQKRQITCFNGTTVSGFYPGENILKLGRTSDDVFYYDLVTPRVATVARNQFNCQSLNGARLENSKGKHCINSHFDERLFYSELMGPIASEFGKSNILSPLTLALLDDSGWYQVNYDVSQVSPFGLGAGCEFVNDRCIISDTVPSYATGSFCTEVSQFDETGKTDSTKSSWLCDPSHRSIAMCNLFASDDLKPSIVQEGFKYFTDSSLQATWPEVDWCPMPISPVGIDCTDASATPDPNYVGEAYGSKSMCVNFELDIAKNRRVAGCFDFQCDATNRHVIVNGIVCEYDDQRIPTQTVDGSFVNMICPKLAVVCPDMFCQGGCSGRGVCNFSTNQCECFDSENTSPICKPRGRRVPFTSPPSSSTSIASSNNWLWGLATIIVAVALVFYFRKKRTSKGDGEVGDEVY